MKRIPKRKSSDDEAIEPAAGKSSFRRYSVPLLGLWAVALLTYSNSFGSPFLFDSNATIVQDPRVWAATPQNVNAILTQDYWYAEKSSGLYRPLTKLSYLFNYAILGSGPSPASYHWFNFALHAVNIALVYFLGLLLLKEVYPALAVAAIWGLHPVLTESVTNVVGRADLLAAFGVLSGLLCHVQSEAASGWKKATWLLALFCAATIGIFSKENAVVLVAGMLLYDLIYRRARWRNCILGYLAVGLPFLAYFQVRSWVLGRLIETKFVGVVQNPLAGANFWTSKLTAVRVIGKQAALWLWPSHLSIDYSYNQIPLCPWRLSSAEVWQALAVVALCAALAILAISVWQSAKQYSFFLAFFLIALVPTSNLLVLIGTIMAERFLYLPSVGLAGCLVLCAYSSIKHLPLRWRVRPMAAPVCLGLLSLAFACRTYTRNLDWSDEGRLWAYLQNAVPVREETLDVGCLNEWEFRTEVSDSVKYWMSRIGPMGIDVVISNHWNNSRGMEFPAYFQRIVPSLL